MLQEVIQNLPYEQLLYSESKLSQAYQREQTLRVENYHSPLGYQTNCNHNIIAAEVCLAFRSRNESQYDGNCSDNT